MPAGVFAFSNAQGFWLSHSNPNFPDNPKDSLYTGKVTLWSPDTASAQHVGRVRALMTYFNAYHLACSAK